MVGTVIGKWLTACPLFVEECKKINNHNYSCLIFYNEETKQRSNTYQPGYSVRIDGGVGVLEVMRLFREVTGASLVKVACPGQTEIYRIQYDLENEVEGFVAGQDDPELPQDKEEPEEVQEEPSTGWKVMADPRYGDRHPYQQNRFIVTANAIPPAVIDVDAHWTMQQGTIICEMRDSADIAENAKLISLAPKMKEILEEMINGAYFRGSSWCVVSGINKAICLLRQLNKIKEDHEKIRMQNGQGLCKGGGIADEEDHLQ